MIPSSRPWLGSRIRSGAPPGARDPLERVLVLCRTQASATAARVALAAEGGRLGVEIATPAGLAAQVAGAAVDGAGDPLPAEPDLPPGSAMAARIGGRPGLTALARRHAAAWRLTRAADPTASGAPPWLDELVSLGWGEDDEQRARLGLLARARAGGLQLGAGWAWDRVVTVGFDVDPGVVDPWARALLDAFGCPAAPAPASPAPLDALVVPDVVAEARLAVELARSDPEGTRVVVGDVATAGRVRDALRRNGLACAWRPATPLAAHPVVPALRRALDWFGAVDPALRSADLCAVLGRLRRLPGPRRHALRARLEALGHDPDEALRRRWSLVDAVERARLLDAPLSRWIERLGDVADEGPAEAAAAALHARGRLELLARALREQGPGLGALRSWLVATGPPADDDPALQTLLVRLGERAGWPAHAGHLAEALAGSLDAEPLSEGVDVVHVDDWDGRPARTLVLLDVHDRGIARRGPPDPLLDDDALRAVGLPAPADVVAHRVDQIHRAVAVAGRALAVVTRRDAAGREVVPPVQLDLRARDAGVGRHGARLALPEDERRRALERREGPPVRPASGDPVLDHLATQATVEWVRAGRGHLPAPVRAPLPHEPLAARLAAVGPPAHDWLLPWLGHAGIPEARLPSDGRAWSADELFRPLTHCAWQAWMRAVVRPRAPRSPGERLDARAVERAARRALDEAGPAARWRVEREGRDEAAGALAAALARATEQAVADTVPQEPLSPARRASAEGQARRQVAHWRRWAAQAVRVRRRVVTGDDLDALRQHPTLQRAREALVASVGEADRAPRWVVEEWLAWVADALARGEPASLWPDDELLRLGERAALPASWADPVRRFLDRPELGRLVALRRGARGAAEVLVGPLDGCATDLPFGEGEPGRLHVGGEAREIALGPVRLHLGEAPIDVRGRLDRVDVVRGPDGPLLHLVAWTSSAEPPDPRRAAASVWTASEPQLLLQALALREVGWPADARARVASVGWEPLRAVEAPRRGPVTVLLDDEQLASAAADLGHLLDRARAGRWTLHPRPDTCPALSRWGHDGCPYGEACRLRGLPDVPP